MNNSFERGKVLMELRRNKEALKELLKAYSEEPENNDIASNICWCYNWLGNMPEMEVWAKKIIEKNPNSYIGYYYLAIVTSKTDSIAAGLHIDRAISLHPHWSALYGFKAGLFLQQENWALAETWAKKGLEIDPNDIYCQKKLIQALTKLNKTEELKESVSIALTNSPDDESAHITVAESYLHYGKIKKARKHLEIALSKDPQNDKIRKDLLETTKAKNPLYYPICYFYYRVKSQEEQKKRELLIYGNVIIYSLAGASLYLGIWAAMCIVLFSLILNMTWFIQWLSDVVFYVSGSKNKHLVSFKPITFRGFVDRGFSIGFFIFTFFILAGKNVQLVLFFALVTASVFLFTYYWRLYYLHTKEKTTALITTVFLCCLILASIIGLMAGKNIVLYILYLVVGIILGELWSFFFSKKKPF